MKRQFMKIAPMACVISVSLLAGCAGMVETADNMAGIAVVSEQKSSFDGKRSVSMSPGWLAKDETTWTMQPIKIGAEWSEAQPDLVLLVLSYDSSVRSGGMTVFSGLDINVDGKISSYKTAAPTRQESTAYNTVSRDIYTKSRAHVAVPMETFRAMLAAKDCKVRINTIDGAVEGLLSLESSASGGRGAILGLRKMLAVVDQKTGK